MIEKNNDLDIEIEAKGSYEETEKNSDNNEASSEIKKETNKNHFSELLMTKNMTIDVPLLSEEVRAQSDAIHYGMVASLLLNNKFTSMEDIVTSLLCEMFKNNISKPEKVEKLVIKASEALFIRNTYIEGEFLQFSKYIQGFENDYEGTMSMNPSWLVCMAAIPKIQKRIVGITTTMYPINMGNNHGSIQILAIVLTPIKDKNIKCDVETSKSLGLILSNLEFRQKIQKKDITECVFRQRFLETVDHLVNFDLDEKMKLKDQAKEPNNCRKDCFGNGVFQDLRKRVKEYKSDFTDAWINNSAIMKTITAIFFLFFANLLPTIAFGMLNEKNTDQRINVFSGLISQLIGGAGFAIFGGQHLTILLTTAPLSIIILVIFTISNAFGYNFFYFYAWVGIFNTLYLWVYAFISLSNIMKFSRRSTEETFSFFIAIAYILTAVEALLQRFSTRGTSSSNEETLLFLLLLLGTTFMALWLHQFTKTPFLNSVCRKILSGFAFPISLLLISIIRYFPFGEIKMKNFNALSWQNITLNIAELHFMPVHGIIGAATLALPVSFLFFMGQNISSSIVNCQSNKLKKSTSYHWDLVVLGILNLILSLFGLPWLHGAPLHSNLYVQSLAATEEHIDHSNHITQKTCRGEREVISEKDRCRKCEGQKVCREKKILEVHIDKGMSDGQQIKFGGEGDQEPGLEPGDIIIVLEEKPHAGGFRRKKNDLVYDMKLDLVESLCGFTRIVTTLDGRSLLIKSATGEVVKHEECRAIDNEGMPKHKNIFERGRLLIHFEVVFPENNFLSLEKINKLRAILPPASSANGVEAMETGLEEAEECVLHPFDPSQASANSNHHYHHGGHHQQSYDSDEEEGGMPGGAQKVQCASN